MKRIGIVLLGLLMGQLVFAQTVTFTWKTTAANTNWSDPANWTTSPVVARAPGLLGTSGTTDVVNVPVGSNIALGSDVTVYNFVITGGVVNLATYKLNITNDATFGNGNAGSGQIYGSTGSQVNSMNGANSSFATRFRGATFGSASIANVSDQVQVNVKSDNMELYKTTMYGPLNMVKTGAAPNNFNGNDVFYGDVSFTNAGTAPVNFGVTTNNDIFNGKLTLINTSSSYITLGYGSANSSPSKVLGLLSLRNYGTGQVLVSYGGNGPVYTYGDIELINDPSPSASSVGITLNYLTMFNGGKIYTNGFKNGSLNVNYLEQKAAAANYIVMDDAPSISNSYILNFANSILMGNNSQYINYKSKINFNTCTLSDAGAQGSMVSAIYEWNYNVVFNGIFTFNVINSTTDAWSWGGKNTFNGDVYLINNAPKSLTLSPNTNTNQTVFNGDLHFTNNVASGAGVVQPQIYFGHERTAYNGDIYIDKNEFGSISLGGASNTYQACTQAAGKRIIVNSANWSTTNANQLWILNLTQNGTEPQSISLPNPSGLYIWNSSLSSGDLKLYVGVMDIRNTTFSNSLGNIDIRTGACYVNNTTFEPVVNYTKLVWGTSWWNFGNGNIYKKDMYFNNYNMQQVSLNQLYNPTTPLPTTVYYGDVHISNFYAKPATGNQTAPLIYLSWGPSNFKGNIYIDNNDYGNIYVGGGANGGSYSNQLSTQDAGKRIIVNTTNWSSTNANQLWVHNLTQNGTEPQPISLPNLSGLYIWNSSLSSGDLKLYTGGIDIRNTTFSNSLGNIDIRTGACYVNNTTFEPVVNYTKEVWGTNWWNFGNGNIYKKDIYFNNYNMQQVSLNQLYNPTTPLPTTVYYGDVHISNFYAKPATGNQTAPLIYLSWGPSNFKGNIYIDNNDYGNIYVGGGANGSNYSNQLSTQDAGKRIIVNTTNWSSTNANQLWVYNLTQNGTEPQPISLPNLSGLYIWNSSLSSSDLKLYVGVMDIRNTTFLNSLGNIDIRTGACYVNNTTFEPVVNYTKEVWGTNWWNFGNGNIYKKDMYFNNYNIQQVSLNQLASPASPPPTTVYYGDVHIANYYAKPATGDLSVANIILSWGPSIFKGNIYIDRNVYGNINVTGGTIPGRSDYSNQFSSQEAGKRIVVNQGNWNSVNGNILRLDNFTQNGLEPQVFTLPGNSILILMNSTFLSDAFEVNANSVTIGYTNFNGSNQGRTVKLTANGANVYKCVINATSTFNKPSGTTSNWVWSGGNSYNGDFYVNNYSGAVVTLSSGNVTWPTVYNGDVYAQNYGTGTTSASQTNLGGLGGPTTFNGNIYIVNNDNGNINVNTNGTPGSQVAGKRIFVTNWGSANINGILGFGNFTQLGAEDQSLSLPTGLGYIYIANSVFNASNLNLSAGRILFLGNSIAGNASLTFTKSLGDSFYGNTFNQNVTITAGINSAGNLLMGNTQRDIFKSNLTLVNDGTGVVYLGYNSLNNTIAGDLNIKYVRIGSIYIGSTNNTSVVLSGNLNFYKNATDVHNGTLLFYNFNKLSSISCVLGDAFTGTITFGNGNVFNGDLTSTANVIGFNGSIFNGKFNASIWSSCNWFSTVENIVFNDDFTLNMEGATRNYNVVIGNGNFKYIFKKNVTINRNCLGYICFGGNPNTGSLIDFYGNFNFNSISTNVQPLYWAWTNNANSFVNLVGTNPQYINVTAPIVFNINRLSINKPSNSVNGSPNTNHVYFNRSIILNSWTAAYPATLNLTSGNLVLAPSAGTVSMVAGGVINGGGANSFIDGKLLKTGNTAFTFPIGKGSVFAPVSMTAPVNATDNVQVEYLPSQFPLTGALVANSPLKDIGNCESWLITPSSTSVTSKFTFPWTTANCTPFNYSVMTLAKLTSLVNGTSQTWSEVANTKSGDNTSGSFATSNTASLFTSVTNNYFTFGYKTKATINTVNVNPTSFSLSGDLENKLPTGFTSGASGTNNGVVTIHPSLGGEVTIGISPSQNNSAAQLKFKMDNLGNISAADPVTISQDQGVTYNQLATSSYQLSGSNLSFINGSGAASSSSLMVTSNLQNGLVFPQGGLFSLSLPMGYTATSLQIFPANSTNPLVTIPGSSWDGKVNQFPVSPGVYGFRFDFKDNTQQTLSYNGQLFVK